jgi:hypothetical protein
LAISVGLGGGAHDNKTSLALDFVYLDLTALDHNGPIHHKDIRTVSKTATLDPIRVSGGT